MELNSFGTDLNTAVFGASGGIGRAFVDALAGADAVAEVHAISRRPIEADTAKITTSLCDPLDEYQLAQTVADITARRPLDLAIITIGILHEGDAVKPEKTWRHLDADAMRRVYEINTIAPTLIAKHVLPKLAKGKKSALAALSARVGSIDDNRLGGWASYRASKAALNMVIRTFSIELARTNPNAVFIGLHPGTVDTNLSEPFQANIPEGKLFTPQYAANRMLEVLDHADSKKSGKIFAYDGNLI